MSWAYQFFLILRFLYSVVASTTIVSISINVAEHIVLHIYIYIYISVILNQNLITASTESQAKVDFMGEEEALSFSSNWQVRILRMNFSVNWKILTNQAFKELLKPAHKQAGHLVHRGGRGFGSTVFNPYNKLHTPIVDKELCI